MKQIIFILLVYALFIVVVLASDMPTERSNKDIPARYTVLKESVVIINSVSVGNGTGFFFDKHYIATNSHVVGEVDSVSVVISGTDKPIPGEVIARFPQKDVAIVFVKDIEGTVLPLADGGEQIGEEVMTLGNPHGLSFSLGVGYVTGSNRVMPIKKHINSFQVDTGIGPGSSGSPVVNKSGEVIGIIYAVMQNQDNFGLAIPISEVKTLLRTSVVLHQLGKV